MMLMLSTYHHQKPKKRQLANKHIVKKIVQTILKASSILLRTKSLSVATLKHYCLD